MTDPIPLFPVTPRSLPEWLAGQAGTVRRWAAAHDFEARAGQVLALPGATGDPAGALVGLGEADPLDPFAWTAFPGALPRRVFALRAHATEAAALGWALGGGVLADTPAGAEPIIRAERDARRWIDTPPNDLGPDDLAELAAEVLAGARVTVIRGDGLAQFPAIALVGGGSARAPCVIDATWGDPAAPKVTLVGKGVCFDGGGLNAKGWAEALQMKSDMAGAAQALALGRLLIEAGAPVCLRILIAAADNLSGGRAMRNGDVVRTTAGPAIEIVHTDYEGRVVLADLLALADAEEPDLLVDFATLTDTGLGPDIGALFTGDEALARDLIDAAAEVRDPLWRLPLWGGYEAENASRSADVANRERGSAKAPSIAAALFLKRFVTHTGAWVHIDFDGFNTRAESGRPLGANVNGLRAAHRLVTARFCA